MTAVQARLDGVVFEVREAESLLDACLRSAIQIPFSCRSGSCQTCLLKCTQGVIPPKAQRGLGADLRSQGYLMACQCLPLGPMTLARPRATDRVTQAAAVRPPETAAPAPDPGLWAELGGPLVRAVLEDFYRQVYRDPRLAPFFHQVTIDRSIDKQYSFLRQLMTGERVYFGDRPRNAHHWMVITEALFDYRQELMVATLLAHGLSAVQIARWTRLELHYRHDIVKSAACPRQLDGVDLPLDGYASERLSAATVCDHCASEIDAGTVVRYHLRLGRVSCGRCAAAVPLLPGSGEGGGGGDVSCG